MTTRLNRLLVPAVAFVIGVLMALALLGRQASLGQAAIAFAIMAAYSVCLLLLQSRSDMASLLSGLPRDERWATINLQALSLAGQVLAVVLVAAFLIVQLGGGDASAYAWLGAVFGLAYLCALAWYRIRS